MCYNHHFGLDGQEIGGRHGKDERGKGQAGCTIAPDICRWDIERAATGLRDGNLGAADGLPGGEALILPLIVLLIYLGWQLGRVWCER